VTRPATTKEQIEADIQLGEWKPIALANFVHAETHQEI
jgi:hypothetical protein